MTTEIALTITLICIPTSLIASVIVLYAIRDAIRSAYEHDRQIFEMNGENGTFFFEQLREQNERIMLALIGLFAGDPSKLTDVLNPADKQDTTATGEHEVASEDVDDAPAVAAKKRNVIELLMRSGSSMEETLPPGNEVTEEQLNQWEQSTKSQ